MLSAEKLLPGEQVFVNHFACTAQGRTFEGAGACDCNNDAASVENKQHSCCGGCVLIDAGSGHIVVKFQHHFTEEETIQALNRCKNKAKDQGIIA